MKTITARQLEARSRARVRGVRVEQVVRGKHYLTRSQTDSTITYRIDKTSAGWVCECDGFRFTGCCKHIAQVERRSEREGWAFGKIASHESKLTPEARRDGFMLLSGGKYNG